MDLGNATALFWLELAPVSPWIYLSATKDQELKTWAETSLPSACNQNKLNPSLLRRELEKLLSDQRASQVGSDLQHPPGRNLYGIREGMHDAFAL